MTLTTELPLRVGVYASVEEANHAIAALLNAGFTTAHLTVMCSDETKKQHFGEFEHQDPTGRKAIRAGATGAVLGAAIGGLSVATFAAATGPLVLWVAGGVGAWTGGVVGGLVGAMMTRGIEQELADFYQQAVVEGDILVAAEAHGPGSQALLGTAERILAEAGSKPMSLEES